MHTVILAGGLGTRLRPVVPAVPKPMAEIAGRPFLEYLLLQLSSQGFRDVVLCLGHMAESVQDHFGDGSPWEMTVEYSVETQPLGTAGALKLAEPRLRGDSWLVLNGDSIFDIRFDVLLRGHAEAGALATLALAQVADRGRYGSVDLGSGTEIAGFIEKRDAHGRGLINGGVYVVERRILEGVPAGRHVSLEREVFPVLVGRGLHGLPLAGDFVDIGMPQDYLRLSEAPEMLLRAARAV